MRREIFLLGSTGSIGVNTLSCVDHLTSIGHPFKIKALAAGKNLKVFEQQLQKYKPEAAFINDEKAALGLKKKYGKRMKVFGPGGLLEAVDTADFDLFVNAAVGSAGCVPTLAAVKKKADIALANKETLIMAGDLVAAAVKKAKVKLLPIDSEHSAIFHLLKNIKTEDVQKLIITASGGPFYFHPVNNPRPAQALKHPTWKMGRKITIDSATLMNKGLEVIEAKYLFGFDLDKIETVIHPQSIVHSMVETIDGEIYGQMGRNDMRLPIQNALTHPHVFVNAAEKINLWEIGRLDFFKTDLKRFPMLKLAYACGRKGGTALAAMNAANEAAVGLYLDGKIDWNKMHRLVEKTALTHKWLAAPDIEHILDLDAEIKERLIRENT